MYHVETPPEVYPEQFEVESQEDEDWWTAQACMVRDISIASDGDGEFSPSGDALYDWYNEGVDGVRAVQWPDPQLIVLDVSLLPQSMSSCGSRSGHSGAILEDAQGGRLSTFGRRLAQVEFQLEDNVALIQDDFLLATVQNPLISLGRMMKRGWKLANDENAETGMSLVAPDGEVWIPTYYKRNSLAVKASIRQVSLKEEEALMVMTIVKVPDGVFGNIGKRGWCRGAIGQGRPFCFSCGSGRFVDPSYICDTRMWRWRPTLVQTPQKENKWKVVELCERYFDKEEPFGPIDNITEGDVILTVVHSREEGLEALGEVLESDLFEPTPGPAQPSHLPLLVDDENNFEFGREPDLPVELQFDVLPEEVEQSDTGGALVELDEPNWMLANRDVIDVGGFEVTENSSLKTLRQAALFLAVSLAHGRLCGFVWLVML